MLWLPGRLGPRRAKSKEILRSLEGEHPSITLPAPAAPGSVSAWGEKATRFVKFFRGLWSAPSPQVLTAALLLARNQRTTLAHTIVYIERLTGQDSWAASQNLVKGIVIECEAVAPAPEDAWPLPYLEKFMEQRHQLHTLGIEQEKGRVQQLIEWLCIS